MKKILMYSDPFKGNIIPTLGISEKLVQMGHEVHYIGIPDATDSISKTSFSYTTVFEEHYPRGIKHEPGKINAHVISSIIKGDFDELMRKHDPAAIVFTAYNPIEAVTFHLRYKVKIVLVYCHFPIGNDFSKNSFTDKVKEWSADMLMKDINVEAVNILIDFLIEQGYKITSLQDVLSVFDDFHNLMTSSKDFLIENAVERDNDLYIGPCIPEQDIFDAYYDTSALEKELLEKHETGKKIMFCSLGSWADEIDKEKTQQIITTLIEAMQHDLLENYVLYISVGNLYDNYARYSSDKIAVHQWLPQMAFLKQAEIAILHGGMGGIKESIMTGTPMIIFPLGLDQFENADRVEAHGLGAKISAHSLNAEHIVSKINEIQNNKDIKMNLIKMKTSFEQASGNISQMVSHYGLKKLIE
ncbi:glycosyltransferase [Chryseobacterium sp. JM1]|uniref:glycosyltransferase n=1 Tax=Chryseobacterium sp. JM1 TaxID=1233950 RepID=UPI000AD297E8|nr:glycosyltransferase [Chryseobacterium sp. JM1]